MSVSAFLMAAEYSGHFISSQSTQHLGLGEGLRRKHERMNKCRNELSR